METDFLDHGDFHKATRIQPVIIFKNPKGKFFIGTAAVFTPEIRYDKDFSYIAKFRITTESFLEITRRDDDDLEQIFTKERWIPVEGSLAEEHTMSLEYISQSCEKDDVLRIKFGPLGSMWVSHRKDVIDFSTAMIMEYSIPKS